MLLIVTNQKLLLIVSQKEEKKKQKEEKNNTFREGDQSRWSVERRRSRMIGWSVVERRGDGRWSNGEVPPII